MLCWKPHCYKHLATPTGSQEMSVKLWNIWNITSLLTLIIKMNVLSASRIYTNLGVAYSSLGQFQEVLYHHEQQLQCAQIVGDSQEGLDSLNQMTTCVMKLGNPAQAAIFYKDDAYKMARQLADTRWLDSSQTATWCSISY